MYAYRQEIQSAELYAVPQRRAVSRPKNSPRIKTVKRKNPAVEFVRLAVTLFTLLAFGIFIFPVLYKPLQVLENQERDLGQHLGLLDLNDKSKARKDLII